LDFSDWRDDLDTKANKDRFFAGIPNIPKKDKAKMAIYLLFIQHIIHSLKPDGKAAVVVPTGFITAQKGSAQKIRKHLVENRMLAGVISMPSNIFATTGTNVSILFIDGSNKEDVVLIDASELGRTVKEGKNQKTILEPEEEKLIVSSFNQKDAVEDFSVVVSYDDIAAKNYSLSAGQYFEIKIEYEDITHVQFEAQMGVIKEDLRSLFTRASQIESEILENLDRLTLND
jgi:type I restriction enzyme M protein